MQAILALEDGTIFRGRAFGAIGERTGEVVFNTGMTGYQEVLTDASYKGQMVCMTYPHIGNYGINRLDYESRGPQVEALIVRDVSEEPSNWLSEESLPEFLLRHGVMGVTDIDTRALTRHLRQFGVMKAVLSTDDLDEDSLVRKAQTAPDISEQHLVAQVSTREPYHWEEGTPPEWMASAYGYSEPALPAPSRPYRVVVVDTGVKFNILRRLVDSGCDVTVVPYDTSAEELLRLEPEGILLANGPGDPESVPETLETARALCGVKPIFGICLGHQILGLAAGGRKFKLKFGHHGFNQPTKVLRTGAVEITSQNHNYAIDTATLDLSEIEITHVNLNDNTLEGMRHRNVPIYSVQFHPEASPGPHDSSMTFHPFIEMMEAERG
ncbi:MAG: glutamine-hydrolyzing carbamoyl-phosphate synthase small subunit [Anaerolineae bacterium]|nr:glutamine-hydrolyzing carbamoyl-phosphate synthase small subunit [Anaerolineae bacterium]